MLKFLAVFIGGGVGSMLRYGISVLVQQNFKTVFPLATLISNLLSCVVLAMAVGYFQDKITAQPLLKLLVVVGFCGGFSTFSTFSLETLELFRNGHLSYALGNILVSVGTCVGIIYFLLK